MEEDVKICIINLNVIIFIRIIYELSIEYIIILGHCPTNFDGPTCAIKYCDNSTCLNNGMFYLSHCFTVIKSIFILKVYVSTKVVQLDANVPGLIMVINANIQKDVVLILVEMEVDALKKLQTLLEISVLVQRVILFN